MPLVLNSFPVFQRDRALRPDYRKTLPVLRNEWENCTQCDLGTVRQANGGAFVFGEGSLGGIMFIGEGPGREENEHGRPFVGKSGQFLRAVLQQVGITNYYITNSVCCRSFSYQYDTEGKQRYIQRRGVSIPVDQDDRPTPVQLTACRDRLFEEIYLVDPKIIVTLGAAAAETVLGRPVKILQESGAPRPASAEDKGTILELPGAGYRPVFTPKGLWRHKVRGVWVTNTVQNTVRYAVYPLLHPAFVLRNLTDNSLGSPKDLFARGLTTIKNAYATYTNYVFGDNTPDIGVCADQVSAAAFANEEE